MKELYIIDDSCLSFANGIETFLCEFITCAKKWNEVSVCLIKLSSHEHEFSIRMHDEIKCIFFPLLTGNNNPFMHYKVITKFLRLYITDSFQNIFLFNYTPCDLLMKSIKEFFPLSKQLFVIHDLGWTAILKGNQKKLEYILAHKNQDRVQKKYAKLFTLIDSEVAEFTLANKVVCLSQDTYNNLVNSYFQPEDKLCLIPNGLHSCCVSISPNMKAKLRKRLLLDADEKLLLLVGRISITKGSYVYLKAFREIVKSYTKCRLVIIGSISSPAEVMKLTKTIASKVTFTGQLSSEELVRWYQVADIGIIPSYTEQCSYTGLEMMHYGLPVVASDGFGVHCMFRDGVNACVAAIENRRSSITFQQNLVAATLRLLNDPVLCKKISLNNRKEFESKYSLSIMNRKYEKLIDRCINDS